MEELSDMLTGKNILCLEEPRKTDGVGVEDLEDLRKQTWATRRFSWGEDHGQRGGRFLFNFFYDEFSVALQSKAAIS